PGANHPYTSLQRGLPWRQSPDPVHAPPVRLLVRPPPRTPRHLARVLRPNRYLSTPAPLVGSFHRGNPHLDSTVNPVAREPGGDISSIGLFPGRPKANWPAIPGNAACPDRAGGTIVILAAWSRPRRATVGR